MKRQPTHEDANLILRLYELRREPKLREARDWFIQNFHVQSAEDMQRLCPPGSDGNTYFRMVTSYWEMVASFVNSGVLHDELYFESGGEMAAVWERVRPIVPAWRAMFKNPNTFRNVEQVVERMMAWHAERGAPEFPELFRQMINSIGKPGETARASAD